MPTGKPTPQHFDAHSRHKNVNASSRRCTERLTVARQFDTRRPGMAYPMPHSLNPSTANA
jgi:hypothetical protein